MAPGGGQDAPLDSDPRAAYFRQMEYGLYVRMALLAIVQHEHGFVVEGGALGVQGGTTKASKKVGK